MQHPKSLKDVLVSFCYKLVYPSTASSYSLWIINHPAEL